MASKYLHAQNLGGYIRFGTDGRKRSLWTLHNGVLAEYHFHEIYKRLAEVNGLWKTHFRIPSLDFVRFLLHERRDLFSTYLTGQDLIVDRVVAYERQGVPLGGVVSFESKGRTFVMPTGQFIGLTDVALMVSYYSSRISEVDSKVIICPLKTRLVSVEAFRSNGLDPGLPREVLTLDSAFVGPLVIPLDKNGEPKSIDLTRTTFRID
ncbi:MAG: hypothetical protein ABII22_04330 [Candidatus Micrarchaeota archaeon]